MEKGQAIKEAMETPLEVVLRDEVMSALGKNLAPKIIMNRAHLRLLKQLGDLNEMAPASATKHEV